MHLVQPSDSRVSTTQAQALYLGGWGRIAGNPQSRAWVRNVVRHNLRVAKTPAEIRRVMDTWRHIHYLGKGGGNVFPPKTIRIHYYLDLPVLRAEPVPWYPAAAVTIRYSLMAGIPKELELESPMQALEIARNFTCDDLRWPHIRDFSPAILREVVRRLRKGTDWAEVVNGRVLWRPRWCLTYSDPRVGHDGGLYRGAGAQFLGDSAGGKQLWGWRLDLT